MFPFCLPNKILTIINMEHNQSNINIYGIIVIIIINKKNINLLNTFNLIF